MTDIERLFSNALGLLRFFAYILAGLMLALGLMIGLMLAPAKADSHERWRMVVVFDAQAPTGQRRTILGRSQATWPSEIACAEVMAERKPTIRVGVVLPNGAVVTRATWRCVREQPGRAV